MTQHYVMLARNLLYTGVTRGKQLVVLVGQRRALAIAVANAASRRRWSKLRERLGSEAYQMARRAKLVPSVECEDSTDRPAGDGCGSVCWPTTHFDHHRP